MCPSTQKMPEDDCSEPLAVAASGFEESAPGAPSRPGWDAPRSVLGEETAIPRRSNSVRHWGQQAVKRTGRAGWRRFPGGCGNSETLAARGGIKPSPTPMPMRPDAPESTRGSKPAAPEWA